MSEDRTPRPRRGYSWPPFEPGHTLSTKHGARSERFVRPIADRLTAELVEIAPWAARPAYGPTVAAWAYAEAQLYLLRAYIDEHGPLDGDGAPRPATALLEKVETRATSLRAELGLTPLSLAKLMAALSAAPAGTDDDGLARLRAEGRALVETRSPAALPAPAGAADRGGDE